MRLLLVEDDRMIGESVCSALRLEGYAVDWVRDAAAADGTLASERFDLVLLLDLGLPRGAAPAARPTASRRRALRARHDATPVIVLTARDARGDRVAGLDAGADDYLVKPFELDELNARIRAVLRRHSRPRRAAALGRRRDARSGEPAPERRSGVLGARVRRARGADGRPGAVLSRAQLEDRLYGWGEEIESNAVSVYIHQLRRSSAPTSSATCAASAISSIDAMSRRAAPRRSHR